MKQFNDKAATFDVNAGTCLQLTNHRGHGHLRSFKLLTFSDDYNCRPLRIPALISTLRNQVEELRVYAQSLEERTTERPPPEVGVDLKDELRKFEIFLITQALVEAGGNRAGAARMLGVRRNTLRSKIKHYGIKINGTDTSKC